MLGALARDGDCIFSDVENHASIIDAIRLTPARKFIYHSTDELEDLLRLNSAATRKIIVTESIFSITGRLANLAEIVKLSELYHAALVVDEAHAAGVAGPRGAGICKELGIEAKVAARVITGGKSLAGGGAFIAGSEILIKTIVNFGRAFIFTTAPPPPVAAALTRAISLAAAADAERETLASLTKIFLIEARARGLDLAETRGPIVYMKIGGARDAVDAAKKIRHDGFEVRAVRPPTVADGEAGIRISIHANHTVKQVRALAVSAARAAKSAPSDNITFQFQPIAHSKPARVFYIIGTDTGVGKTVVSAALVAAAAESSPVYYWKPVGTGAGDDDDTKTIERILKLQKNITIFPPAYQFAPPIAPEQAAARAGTTIEMEILAADYHKNRAAAAGGIFIIEGAGGLAVPFTNKTSQEEFIKLTDAPVVLVARAGLGTINHTRLTLEALAARRISVAALVLAGAPHPENRAALGRFVNFNKIFELNQLTNIDAASVLREARSSGITSIFTEVAHEG